MNPPTKDSHVKAQSLPQKGRSRTIPLPSSHIARTQSELQLSEDMAAAEWKDLCMFYRVVGGIREQQQQRHSHTNGAPIHLHERQRQPQHAAPVREGKSKPIRDWTGKDVSSTADTAARVTPFDPTSEASPPPQGTYPPYPRSLLLRSPKRRSSADGGGWSITGFDEDSPDASPLALIGKDSIDDDGAVFVMDL